MSELIEKSNERLDNLFNFARRLTGGDNGRQLIYQYKPYIETVTPSETMEVLDKLLQEGIEFEKVKANTGRIINVFYRSLSKFHWDKPADGHFLSLLMDENRAVERIMDEVRLITKDIFGKQNKDEVKLIMRLKLQLNELKKYESHYIKKENLLFPVIEKTYPRYRCLQLMWSFHDDFRKTIKELEKILESDLDKNQFNKLIGSLFFVVLPIIFREEKIVFPVAFKAIPPDAWTEMLEQSYDLGWCYIDPPEKAKEKGRSGTTSRTRFDLGTGIVTLDQLTGIFSSLPVDLTFVDENDTVTFFSEGPHRIFPRSKAIIGRKVQNCHPPDSVHIVNEIIEAFRENRKSSADFWINMKGRFVHIRYFAVRGPGNKYLGTLEVTQDVTEIRSLEGERRLPDWSE